jgi:hypothetical protein
MHSPAKITDIIVKAAIAKEIVNHIHFDFKATRNPLIDPQGQKRAEKTTTINATTGTELANPTATLY